MTRLQGRVTALIDASVGDFKMMRGLVRRTTRNRV